MVTNDAISENWEKKTIKFLKFLHIFATLYVIYKEMSTSEAYRGFFFQFCEIKILWSPSPPKKR